MTYSTYTDRHAMTEDEVYQALIEAVKKAGGQRAFAIRLKLTPSYINDVVHKRRLMSDRILEAIGVERVVIVEYRKKEQR